MLNEEEKFMKLRKTKNPHPVVQTVERESPWFLCFAFNMILANKVFTNDRLHKSAKVINMIFLNMFSNFFCFDMMLLISAIIDFMTDEASSNLFFGIGNNHKIEIFFQEA